jgi:hypothetical protein
VNSHDRQIVVAFRTQPKLAVKQLALGRGAMFTPAGKNGRYLGDELVPFREHHAGKRSQKRRAALREIDDHAKRSGKTVALIRNVEFGRLVELHDRAACRALPLCETQRRLLAQEQAAASSRATQKPWRF